jgi:hypothetical protein
VEISSTQAHPITPTTTTLILAGGGGVLRSVWGPVIRLVPLPSDSARRLRANTDFRVTVLADSLVLRGSSLSRGQRFLQPPARSSPHSSRLTWSPRPSHASPARVLPSPPGPEGRALQKHFKLVLILFLWGLEHSARHHAITVFVH